jgi:hypothetical protein
MKYVVDILLAAFALWSAHLAGVHYALSREDPKHTRQGILRTILALVAMGALIVGQVARS